MALLTPDRQPDRKAMLKDAQRARARGRNRRAIALYQYTLSLEVENVELMARLAPLLAFEGRHFEAWRHFRAAGGLLVRQGQAEWALAVFREATRCVPKQFDAWRLTAELERKLGRLAESYETLLDARSQFRGPLERDQAIALLELARQLEPWDAEVVIDLAQLMSRSGQLDRGLELLDELAEHCSDVDLRRVRAAQLRITWSFHHLWQWLLVTLPRFAAGRPPSRERSWFEAPDWR